MAREKGTGSLQKEKSGRFTARICVGGKRFSRSTRTANRDKAEAYLNRLLLPFGLGARTLPLAEVWREYEKSPHRRDMATATMASKRTAWMHFAEWIEENHAETTHLHQLSQEAVAEYLRVFRVRHSATTYNNAVCALREICRVVSDGQLANDPWAGVCLLADDSHSRREFTRSELVRIMDAAERAGRDWLALFAVGMYTGLRLGDCCTLLWESIDAERQVIQVVPQKTRRHANARPVTIPVHAELRRILEESGTDRSGFVLPRLADWYTKSNWRIGHGLAAIFKDAKIVTSVPVKGRRRTAPDATFHSLRHTFVSFSANAGVPLPVVSSIVGHSSTAMTRHYYHENEEALRRAVDSVPGLAALRSGKADAPMRATPQPPKRRESVAARLRRIDALLARGIVAEDEWKTTRQRILGEI